MLWGLGHDPKHVLDEGERHVLMEQVAHRVHENAPPLAPRQGGTERAIVKHNFAGPLVTSASLARRSYILFLPECLQASGHSHGVTVGATGREDGATCNGVPGGVSP